jgi:predicted permease
MFARATARERELVVRSALGASRRRIITQLFVEALVLASVAAVAGLAAARHGIRWVLRIAQAMVLEGDPLPSWFRAELSSTTLFYAALLTVLAAVVAGVLPGLKVTRDLGRHLQRAAAGGGGFRFGGVWTVVIVCQIAVTMIFPLFILVTRSQSERELAEDLALPAHEYVSARLGMTPSGPAAAAPEDADAWRRDRFGPSVQRLEARLTEEPRITGVAFTERLPRQYHPWRQIEVDGPTAEPRDERGHRLASSTVTLDYFDVVGARVVAGRGFRPADLGEGPGAVVVNESFVRRILGGRNAVGQRVRYLASEEYRDPSQDPGPWHEIVGVVEDMGTLSGYGPQGMYHPARAGEIQPVHVVMHVRGEASTFVPVLQSVAADVDPSLRLHQLFTLDQVTLGQREFFAFWTTILVTVSGLALLLSLGGIFAVMSYTVARRTREIGIRVALGADARRIVLSIFRRPLTQVAAGIVVGGVLAALYSVAALTEYGGAVSAGGIALLLGYVAFMLGVCLLACVVPTRRALGVEPAEALSLEG